MDLIPNTIIQIFLKMKPTSSIRDHPIFETNKILWKTYAQEKGFKYIFLNEDNIAEYLGEHKEFYYNMRFQWNRIDFLRYLVLNKIGGYYVDLDCEPCFDKDLFELSKEEFILDKWYNPKSKKWELNNALMGCRPNFFNDLINYSILEYNCKSKMEIYNIWKIRFMLETTGVRMFKRWCKNNKYSYTGNIHDYIVDGCSATWLKDFN